MSKRVRSVLAQVRSRLRGLVERPEPIHVADLSDTAFFAALQGPAAAVLAALDGRGAAAQRAIVDYFIGAERPRFFCSVSEIAPLARRLASDRPGWVEAVCSRVAQERESGLRVLGRLGMPLDHRFEWCDIPGGPGRDDLYSAQPHRFGFLPRLALAAAHGRDTLPLISVLLDRWMAAVAAGERECYHSPMAVLYRVLASSWALTLTAGCAVDEAVRVEVAFKLLKILRADCAYLAASIGHSYPNNHLLADGFAGWFIGTLYPEFAGTAQARTLGEPIFLRELSRQFFADGGNFEHSCHYHELGCEMAAAYVLLSRRNGVEPPPEVLQRLRSMLSFQAAVGGPEARPLALGDTIEDPLFPLDAEHGWANGAMRELLRALFEPAVAPAPAQDSTVERAFWLLGGALAPAPAEVAPNVASHFDQAGVHVLPDEQLSARLVLRAGPMQGQALSAGHSHSDLLSVHLNVNGTPLIVNAGTYTYRSRSRWPKDAPDWRSYMAGPRSHNGLDFGADPLGALTGDFRNRDVPCRVAAVRRAATAGLSCLEFVVEGPNTAAGHRRCIVHVAGLGWLVIDSFAPELPRGSSAGLQFAPGTQVELATAGMQAVLDRAGCSVHLGPGWAAPTLLCGSTEPLGGWVSPRYGELAAAPQLRVAIAPGAKRGVMLLRPALDDSAVDTNDILEWCLFDEGIGLKVAVDEGMAVLLVRDADARGPLEAWGRRCDGVAAWWHPGGDLMLDVGMDARVA